MVIHQLCSLGQVALPLQISALWFVKHVREHLPPRVWRLRGMCVKDLAHNSCSVNLSSFLLELFSPWEAPVQGEVLGWGSGHLV